MSVTTLAPGSVTEVIEAYEFEPTCEARSGCSNSAQVVLFYACTGGCSDQVCWVHRDSLSRFVREHFGLANLGLGGFRCRGCDHLFESATSWEEIVLREVPL